MVKWQCASLFAAAGIAGAFIGSTLGNAMDGQKLLFLFALLMIVTGILMLRSRSSHGDAAMHLNSSDAPRLVGAGLLAGGLSGFFGIWWWLFDRAPGLMSTTGMPIINAVGSSLLAVAAFGTATAANYAASARVGWPLAAVAREASLADLAVFAWLVFAAAGYMLYQNHGVF